MSRDSSPAPSAPGEKPTWTRGSKSGVGTALTDASNLWFTLGTQSLEEIYYPSADHACVRDMAFAVADGRHFFSWEKEDADGKVEIIEDHVPAYRIETHCRRDRYRIVKEIAAHSQRSAILQRVRFFPQVGENLQLYAVLTPQLGDKARAWVGSQRNKEMLFAATDGLSVALACSAPWKKKSVGFVGTSDPLRDLSKHKEMTREYDRAEEGFVTMAGQVDCPAEAGEFLISIGFGPDSDTAGLNAYAALLDGFPLVMKEYVTGWKEWQRSLLPLDQEDSRTRFIYRTSMNVLRTHEGKVPRGSMIASATIPFGQVRRGQDTGGYHLVWVRDLTEAAGGFLAGGMADHIHDTLTFLEATQLPDGHWPQNMYLNGKPHWTGIQMDETALAVLLFDLARRTESIDPSDTKRFWPMVRKAAGYLIANGPITEEGRWELQGGYSTYTLGAEIAALLAAAELADQADEPQAAHYMRQTADLWNANIERWTYVTGTKLAAKAEVEGYYVRMGEPRVRVEFPDRSSLTRTEEDMNNVSPDALALVRFGLRSPHDPRLVNTVKVIDQVLKVDLGYGPGWRRYLDDTYGEDKTGTPDPGGRRGIGRAWPLFIGERGHFELAAGRRDEAEQLLRLMEKTAIHTGLIPEQIWDAPDIPEKGLFRGGPTTSANPLVWAHAEYIKLLRSLWDNAVFDLPPQTIERYGRANEPPKLRVWRPNHKIEDIPAGQGLRIELQEPATVRWTAAKRKEEDTPTTDTGLGVHYVDLPAPALPAGATVAFSIHRTATDKWDRNEYEVKVTV